MCKHEELISRPRPHAVPHHKIAPRPGQPAGHHRQQSGRQGGEGEEGGLARAHGAAGGLDGQEGGAGDAAPVLDGWGRRRVVGWLRWWVDDPCWSCVKSEYPPPLPLRHQCRGARIQIRRPLNGNQTRSERTSKGLGTRRLPVPSKEYMSSLLPLLGKQRTTVSPPLDAAALAPLLLWLLLLWVVGMARWRAGNQASRSVREGSGQLRFAAAAEHAGCGGDAARRAEGRGAAAAEVGVDGAVGWWARGPEEGRWVPPLLKNLRMSESDLLGFGLCLGGDELGGLTTSQKRGHGNAVKRPSAGCARSSPQPTDAPTHQLIASSSSSRPTRSPGASSCSSCGRVTSAKGVEWAFGRYVRARGNNRATSRAAAGQTC